jgi:Spy/CpxP family protein refolding chaperone
MRRILRVGAAVFALLVAANVARAQGGGGGGGGGGGARGGRGGPQGQNMADRYLADITLTDDQKGKLAEVVKWYDEEAGKIQRPAQDADSTARAAFMTARQKLTTDYQAKIKAFLTPEQVTKFDANVAAAAQRGGGRGRGN